MRRPEIAHDRSLRFDCHSGRRIVCIGPQHGYVNVVRATGAAIRKVCHGIFS